MGVRVAELTRAGAELRAGDLDSDQREVLVDHARSLVREAVAAAVGLLPVTEAAAEAICWLAGSTEVTISLFDGQEYWDVVEFSAVPTDYPRFPDARYSFSDYPLSTDSVLSGKGYVSGEPAQEMLQEYSLSWPDTPVGSIMGVPIIALGSVHGEIFLLRSPGEPSFTRDDLDLVSDMATLLGARLPALIAAYAADDELDATLSGLTDRLAEHLGDA